MFMAHSLDYCALAGEFAGSFLFFSFFFHFDFLPPLDFKCTLNTDPVHFQQTVASGLEEVRLEASMGCLHAATKQHTPKHTPFHIYIYIYTGSRGWICIKSGSSQSLYYDLPSPLFIEELRHFQHSEFFLNCWTLLRVYVLHPVNLACAAAPPSLRVWMAYFSPSARVAFSA